MNIPVTCTCWFVHADQAGQRDREKGVAKQRGRERERERVNTERKANRQTSNRDQLAEDGPQAHKAYRLLRDKEDECHCTAGPLLEAIRRRNHKRLRALDVFAGLGFREFRVEAL